MTARRGTTTADPAAGFRSGGVRLAAWLPVWLLILSCPAAFADRGPLLPAGSGPPQPVIAVDTVWSADGIRPGGNVTLAVVFSVPPGYHINADEAQLGPTPGFLPVPTRVRPVRLPEDFETVSLRYPPAHPVKLPFSDEDLMVFDGRVVVRLELRAAEDAAPGPRTVVVEAAFQACDDRSCLLPETVERTARIPVVGADDTVAALRPEIFDAGETGAPAPRMPDDAVTFDLFGWTFSVEAGSPSGRMLLLAMAAVGGLLLNFTPCVLPLIPVKIISLASSAERKRLRCVALGGATFAGVLAFWLLLGALVAGASGFTAANQLFQYPLFTLTVGAIIAVMAAGMFGSFSVRLPSVAYRFNPQQDSLGGSFALGVLTAVLSTPCTAPFMGAAAAWAVTRTPAATLTTFAAIGTGMALPYLLLSMSPDTVRKIPRSGPASALVKEMMGWFLLAAAAYFIGTGVGGWTAADGQPPTRAYWWVVAGLVAFSGVWLAVRTVRITRKTGFRILFVVVGLLLVLSSLTAGRRLADPGPVEWTAYTPQRMEQALQRGRTVVLVFTAEWCLNCKALEQSVLRDPRVEALFSDEGVVPMKVDITGSNPEGKKKLAEMGSVTIPLLAVVAPDGTVTFQSDFYTAEQVVRAVEAANDR